MLDELAAAALSIGIKLSSEQLLQFQTYFEELIAGNDRFNLTAVTDEIGVQSKHFLDSLTVVLAGRMEQQRLIDIGSGAGFPGIPLKIAFPGIHLALLEATGKKAVFLEQICKRLGLAEVVVINRRAEEAAHLPEYRERFDIAVSRAVAELPALVELMLPFCKTSGVAIAQKKGAMDSEVRMATRAIDILGGRIREIISVNIKPLPDERKLVVIEKMAPTPGKYPRRSGIPHKRPLGQQPTSSEPH